MGELSPASIFLISQIIQHFKRHSVLAQRFHSRSAKADPLPLVGVALRGGVLAACRSLIR